MSNLTDRYRTAKIVYSEDECARDGEFLDAAWRRLFSEVRPYEAITTEDCGDTMIYEYPGGRFAQIGMPRGGMTEIRVEENP